MRIVDAFTTVGVMCGLVGWIGAGAGENRQVLEAMTRALSHRGPDEEGFHVSPDAAFGHRRLTILAPVEGHQPIVSRKSGKILLFNGEIFNFAELAADLAREGVDVPAKSDAVVLAAALDHWGENCVSRLEGMFAFSWWDPERRDLLLARDRFGKKPLYVFVAKGMLVFSSELKALLKHPEVPRLLDPEGMIKFLCFDYIPSPGTILQGVQKLEPGTILRWNRSSGRISIDRYWEHPRCMTTPISLSEAVEETERLLHCAVKIRLRSDAPLGFFVSGGLDSSLVLAVADRIESVRGRKSFSIGFEEPSFDEREHAGLIARRLGTDHSVEVFTSADAKQSLQFIASLVDEPMADPSILPTAFLSRLAGRSVKAVLSGDGGDEIFAGYENYRAACLSSWYLRLPRVLRKGVLEEAVRTLRIGETNLPLTYKLQRFAKGIDYPMPVRNYVWLGAHSPGDLPGLLTIRALEACGSLDAQKVYREALREKAESSLESLLRADLRLYLAEDILVKIDRAGMFYGLEVRSPYLDHALTDFVLSLPLALRFPGLTLKPLLKRIARPYLPRSIIHRSKKGFGIPLGRWMRRDLRPAFEETLSSAAIKGVGIFQEKAIHALWEQHQSNQTDHRKTLWSVFILQRWCEENRVSL